MVNLETSDKIEFELKFKVNNFEKIREIILKHCKFVEKRYENDFYFDFEDNRLFYSDKVLRVRIYNGKVVLTYKGKRFFSDQNKIKAREEIEVKVDGKDIIKILEKIGMKCKINLIKTREIYSLNNNITICLDDIHNLGKFVEIEVSAKDTNEAYDKIKEISKMLNLNINDSIKKSYLELLTSKIKN